MTNCALYYYWHWQWHWQKFWYLHPSKFSTTNVDIVSSSHPSNPHTWWPGGRPPTDQWPPDPKPAPSQHLSISHLVTHHTSTHLYFLHKWTQCITVFMLAQYNANAQPYVQFFTTYIDLCKSFIIIFSCRISIFNLNPWSILTHMKLMLWSHLNTFLWCCLLCLCGLDVTPSHSPTTC